MSQQAEPGWMTMVDGVALRTFKWLHDADTPARGCVLVVHGLGEHGGRYARVAEQLNRWGFDAFAFDQYGHGDSPGKRGTLTTATRLLDDLGAVVDQVRAGLPRDRPLILLGHSMGGALAARFVAEGRCRVDGAVLSSPALDSGMKAWQRVLAQVLETVAPDFTIANGLPVEAISHDPAEVCAYRADPKVHDRISGRLARFVDGAGAVVSRAASTWQVPTLLLYAGDDRFVDAEGSRRFARSAADGMVVAREFPRHFHELFNEAEREPVFGALERWLDLRFPA